MRDRGITILLVTHSMEEAERLCDRVALIDAGHVAALDSPAVVQFCIAMGSLLVVIVVSITAMQGQFPPAVPLLVLAGYTVVFSFLAQRFFRWE